MHKVRQVYLELVLLASVLAVDQLVKYLAQYNLPWQQQVPFLPGLVSLYYTRNTGAAFSILSDQRWLLSIMGVTVLGAMIYGHDALTENRPILRTAWAMVFGGAIGNLFDRIVFGSVVDFFLFDFIRFPVFNVADIAITCGGGLFILALLREEYQRRQRSKSC